MTGQISQEDIAKFWADLIENGTPDQNGKCKTQGCGGTIIKEVTGMYRGLHFGTPKCRTCGRIYTYAQRAIPVGVDEFLDSLRRPMTI